MVEYDLPEKDDAPWLNTTHDGFMTHEEMIEEAQKREEDTIVTAKVSAEDYIKVLNAMRERKTFEEMTREERVDSAIQEIWYIVQGGQDGKEFADSIFYVIKVLESLK